MKQLGLTTFVTFGAFAAVGACGDEEPPASLGTGGTSTGSGGTSAGTSGSGDGGSGGTSQECAGPPPNLGRGGGSTGNRMEGVQCYVTDTTNGEPECLAADAPGIVTRISDVNTSCAFAIEFVIGGAESQPVPAACEELLECCESLPADGLNNRQCHDRVDSSRENCANYLEWYRSLSICSEPSGGDAGVASAVDGGAPARSSRYALCCYRVCGHFECI